VAVTSYHTVSSQILGETTSGTRVDYLSDALGSVTATTNSSGVVQNRYRYKPYGSRLAKTGSAADPKFQWIGRSGYRTSSTTNYVRARTYAVSTGRWNSVDPLRSLKAYEYAASAPTVFIDPSGMAPAVPTNEPRMPSLFGCNKATNRYVWEYCNWCYSEGVDVALTRNCIYRCHELSSRYYDLCGKPKRNPDKYFRPPLDDKGYLARHGGEVAPYYFGMRQQPCPQQGPVFTTSCCRGGDGFQEFLECFNYASGDALPGMQRPRSEGHTFALADCENCCAFKFYPLGYECPNYSWCLHRYRLCKDACLDAAYRVGLKMVENVVTAVARAGKRPEYLPTPTEGPKYPINPKTVPAIDPRESFPDSLPRQLPAP
jgi:RHS repeat-associated protein